MGKSVQNKEVVVGAAFFVSLCFVTHFVVTSSIIGYEGNRAAYFKMQDFHYYIVLIKTFWSHEIVSIYDPTSQLMAIGNYFGIRMNHVMPLGISPTALFVLLPFSVVAKFSFPLANTLWVSAFLTIYAIAVLKTYSYIQAYERNALPLFIVAFSFFLFSFRTVTVIFLGQMSLLASALLLFLLLEMALARREERSLRRWIIYTVIFVLSMKLHYLILGMGILLLGGYIYEMLVSSVIVGMSIGFLLVYTGLASITGFMGQISLFSAQKLPAYYDFSDVFHTFVTFRSAFAPIIGASLSLKISLFVLLFGCMAVFCISVFRSGGTGEERKKFEKIAVPQMMIALFAMLLLFMPYIGGYEDVLLCVPFASVCLIQDHMRGKYGWIFALIPFLFIVLNQGIMLPPDYLWLNWCMKAFIFIALFFFPKIAIPSRVEIAGQWS
jgi:hypothetical protein